MSRYILMASFVGAMAVALAAQAPQQGTKFIGTWKLDVARSHYTPGPAPKAETVTVGAADISIEGTNADGTPYHASYAPIQGKAVPVTGGEANETATVTRVNSRTLRFENVVGKGKMSGRVVLARSGNLVTATFQGTDKDGKPVHSREVYTRQP